MGLQVITPETLAKDIETLVTVKRLSYLDAVVYYCETRKIEPEAIAPYLSDKIKSHLALDGRKLHLLPRQMDML